MDCFPVVITALLLASAGPAADVPLPAPLGTRVAEFTLPKSDGGTWSLARRTRGARAVVVLFLGTECPVSNAYVPVLTALYEKYRGREVVFVAINSNVQDDAAEVARHAREYGVPFPVLKDKGTEVADHFRARRVPEAFVLDGNLTARYRGRIDDRFARGVKRPQATTHDLAAALDDVLAGKAVRTPVTEVSGCPIGRAARAKARVDPAQAVTYCKQVVRILQKSCQTCHRQGEAGPFELFTYADAAAWAEAIAENVREGRMPPWHADPTHGTFANDRRLADTDRQALLDWVDQGCPEGDAAELPAPRPFVEGWGIGQPDEVIAINKEIEVAAQAPPGGVSYRYVLAGKPFNRDRWVSAAEVRPGTRSLVHHINVYVLRPGRKKLPAGDEISERLGKELFEDPSEASLRDIPELVSYAPGDPSFELPHGMAKRIPKGSQLVFELHLVPDGKARTDRSVVGLKYLDGPPEREVIGGIAINWLFLIPPGAADHRVTTTHTFDRESVLLSMSPHMHLRGKSFEYVLVTPDGAREVLLSVPKYDFNWQTTYHLAEPRRVPKGSRLECTAVYDNSDANPNNPDPRSFVIWGDQSWNEMMMGYFDYYHP
jgi:peroxiredoxin